MMDKQAAIQFIVNELERNRTQDEITAALSQQLNAPPDVVSKFVARVSAGNQATETPAQPPSTPPPDLETLPQPDPEGQIGYPAVETAPEQLMAPPATQVEGSPPAPQEYTFPNERAPVYDQEAMEAMILKALRCNQRQSDIVMDVCENTWMSWNQAQRLVARIATKHHKHLVSRQNMIIIPLSALALLAGLALLGASINEGLQMAQALAESPSDLPASTSTMEFFIREGLWGLVIGMSLLLGGIYGLIRALQTQFS
jgi:hypothetical protein